MSVKVCCAVVLVLAVFLPTSTQAQGKAQPSAECGAAMAELMKCVKSYEVDFERLEDPSYIPEMCRETKRLGGCLEAAKGKCPSHPFFEGQEAGSMAHMLAQLQTMCPQPSDCDGEGGAPTNTACPNPIQEMSKCSRIMDSLSPNGPSSSGPPACEQMEEAELCMLQFVEDCGDHPMIAGEDLTAPIQQVRSMMSMACGDVDENRPNNTRVLPQDEPVPETLERLIRGPLHGPPQGEEVRP